VPDLARAFLQKSAKELGVETKRLSNNAMARLMAFNFPGNVRQLENICHWLTVMAPAQIVDAKDLPPELMVQENLAGTASVPPVFATPPVGLLTPEVQPLEGVSSGTTMPADRNQVAVAPVAAESMSDWLDGLEKEATALLASGATDVWDRLTRRFEGCLIQAALNQTRGRRIEAALKLGIGRNTITRKIQELGMDD
jgi:two-component system, NtrC family, nitrogen regulation response regulator GlnG